MARSSPKLVPFAVPQRAKLTDPQLQAIGLVISEWGLMEQSLFISASLTFEVIPGTKPPLQNLGFSVLIGAGMTPRTVLGLMNGLFDLALAPDTAVAFKKLSDHILDCGQSRDAIAHGAWRKGKRPGSITTASVRAVGQIRLEQREFTVSEMTQLAERIRVDRLALLRFMRDRGYFSLLDTPAEPPREPQST